MTLPRIIPVGLIGAGRIGTSHAEIIAHRVPRRLPGRGRGPAARSGRRPGSSFGARGALAPAASLEADDVEAVVIAASVRRARRLVVAAAAGRQGRSSARSRWR